MASGREYTGDAWREFVSERERADADDGDNLFERADVWTFPGEGSWVEMVFTSPSGDWLDRADYCFRRDGTLGAIDAELRTFFGGMIVDRHWDFGQDGRAVEGPTTYRELKSGAPTSERGPDGLGFHGHDVPQYATVRHLPFWELLGR